MQQPETGAMVPIPEETYQQHRRDRTASVFKRGEVLNIRGGAYRVVAIGAQFIRLESLPASYLPAERDDAEPELLPADPSAAVAELRRQLGFDDGEKS